MSFLLVFPFSFQHELISKLGTSYPNVSQIFDSYADVVRTLNLKTDSSARNDENPKFKGQESSSSRKSTSVNHATNDVKKACKFCACATHTMLNCTRYVTVEQRRKRCSELGLCSYCSSTKHDHTSCNAHLDHPCKYCNSHKHISALCSKIPKPNSTNVCINSLNGGGCQNLLPTLTVNVMRSGKSTPVRCLIDFGSQRTYFFSDVLKRIGCPMSRVVCNQPVSGFLGNGTKPLSELSLSIDFSDGLGYRQLPVYIDKNFHLEFHIDKLNYAMQNLGEDTLADTQAVSSGDLVKLEGVLGVDSIQFFGDFRKVKCMRGAAISIGGKLIPYGDIQHFLTKEQISFNRNVPSPVNAADSSLVNFALSPDGHHFDPISSVITDSQVEGHWRIDTCHPSNLVGQL